MRAARFWVASVAACLLSAGVASAQSGFQLTVTQQGSAFIIPNGQVLTFSDPIGQTETVRITATYLGLGQVTITQAPLLFGSTAFSVNLVEKLPLSLNNGGSFSLDVSFHPTSAIQGNAQLTVIYVEALGGTTPNSTPTLVSNSINLGLQGTAPSFVLSYVLPADQNVVPIAPGSSLVFPPTAINTTAQATFNVTNRGSGPGRVNGVTITGASFRPVLLPLFPITLAAGQNLSFLVQYLPTTASADTGEMQISVDATNILRVGLQGGGTSAVSILSYQVLQGSSSTPVEAGGTISLPDTKIGETNNVVVQVKNTGNAPATINSLSVAGAGFQVTDPPALPQTLPLNSTLTFSVAFTPNKPGVFTGRLTTGSDTFALTGRGLGPNLDFSFVSGGSTIPVANNLLVFSPVTVSSSGQQELVVRNTGTAAARIANIGIQESNSPFTLTGVPPLPLNIDPDGEVRFRVVYTPVTTGFTNGTLRLDSTVVNLLGSGNPPPAVPSYTFQGPTGNVDPLSQPAVRLSLSRPYPIPVVGTLTMTVSGGPADPAVQFATGGRTVPFLIAANTTDAIFAGQGPQIRLQTGTVAGTITLTPTFATQGGLNLISDSSAVLQFTVAAAAPTLISARITNPSASGFTIVATGFSTTRALTNLDIKITPKSGFTLVKNQFTIDIRQISTIWFQSTASQPFGGQFTVSSPFTIGGLPSGLSVLDIIDSLAVTVSSEVGSSTALTISP